MNEEKVKVTREILQYLVDNPHAQDTVEGIDKWWVPERTIKQRRLVVQQALDALVAEDLVIEWKGRDSQKHYKINDRRHEEILSLLRSTENESASP